MHTSQEWIRHFQINASAHRVNWDLKPDITSHQLAAILPSLQAWQLGETSDGSNLLRAAAKYAGKTGDTEYVEAIQLFVKEEQKHGANLGRYLDAIGQPRITADWGDSLFRRVRHFNTSMEAWTLAVIVVESTAQIFYQSLKDASNCILLKQICRDILIDEAYHIEFQVERMSEIFQRKSPTAKLISRRLYKLFFFATIHTVWFAHRSAFEAGGNTYTGFMKKMKYKYYKTLYRISFPENKLQLSLT